MKLFINDNIISNIIDKKEDVDVDEEIKRIANNIIAVDSATEFLFDLE